MPDSRSRVRTRTPAGGAAVVRGQGSLYQFGVHPPEPVPVLDHHDGHRRV
jgi:hypothetical protein